MLVGDKAKYLGIVFGVSFAALLMAQQSAIFCGLMRNTTSQIRDIQGAGLTSPITGQVVEVEGIVVGSFRREQPWRPSRAHSASPS